MGFLTDLRTLSKAGSAQYAALVVSARMGQMQQSIAQASALLAASSTLPAAPTASTATVVSARQLPMMIGLNAVVELELTVFMPSGVPVPVLRTEQVAPLYLSRLVPGATVPVVVDVHDPTTVRLAW
jgi:hypothetical protein